MVEGIFALRFRTLCIIDKLCTILSSTVVVWLSTELEILSSDIDSDSLGKPCN